MRDKNIPWDGAQGNSLLPTQDSLSNQFKPRYHVISARISNGEHLHTYSIFRAHPLRLAQEPKPMWQRQWPLPGSRVLTDAGTKAVRRNKVTAVGTSKLTKSAPHIGKLSPSGFVHAQWQVQPVRPDSSGLGRPGPTMSMSALTTSSTMFRAKDIHRRRCCGWP